MMPRSPYSPFPLVRLLLEHRRALLGVPFAAALVAVVVGLVMGATYRAESSFKPQAEGSDLARFSGLASQLGINLPAAMGESGESLDFYARLTRSRALLGAVAQREYPLPKGRGSLLEYYDAGGRSPEERLLKTVEELAGDLQVQADMNSGVIGIRTRARGAALAEQVNRAILDEVNRFNLEVRQTQASAERQFVEGQVAQAQQELQAAEAELGAFMERNRRYEEWPQLRFEAARLQRRVDLQQQVYTTLVQARERSRLDEVRNTPVITILDPPEGSAKRKRGLLTKAVLGAVLGLVLVLSWIFLREYTGRLRREYPEEYEQMRAAAPKVGRVLPLLLAVALAGCSSDGIGPVENPPAMVAVAAGAFHTCALTGAGRAFCWGRGEEGQLGDGGTARRTQATPLAGGNSFDRITAGDAHTCALDRAGVAWCWGFNGAGQLGTGGGGSSAVPAAVTGGPYVLLTAGTRHTCALDAAGVARCWGANDTGQLGDGTLSSRATPVPVGGELRFRDLSAGGGHTCGIATDGATWCWGANELGQLGVGSKGEPQSQPAPVAGGHGFSQVAAGADHTCAVALDKLLYCWGGNYFGQLGIGYGGWEDPEWAVPVLSVRDGFLSVNAGDRTSCGVRTSGQGWCWGRGDAGQVGDGTHTDQYWPQDVRLHAGDQLTFHLVAVGGRHACGISAELTVFCWGDGRQGQLGRAAAGLESLPLRVTVPS